MHVASGCRIVELGSFKVLLSPLLEGGLSPAAYSSSSPQSDKQYAAKLNPGYLTGGFGENGALVAMFLSSLISSCWHASKKQRARSYQTF